MGSRMAENRCFQSKNKSRRGHLYAPYKQLAKRGEVQLLVSLLRGPLFPQIPSYLEFEFVSDYGIELELIFEVREEGITFDLSLD